MSTFSMMKSLPRFLLFVRGNFTPVISSDRQHKGEEVSRKNWTSKGKIWKLCRKKNSCGKIYCVFLGGLQIPQAKSC